MAPVLVGRDEERATLAAAVERASRAYGGVVVLRGEAGAGKSALAHDAGERARAAGLVVTIGRAWEAGQAPPYLPAWPLFRHLGIERPAAVAGDDEPDASAFRLWDDVLDALARKSAETPQLVVLEDLHAADAATLALVAYLAQPLRALSAVVLVTARTADPALDARKAALLSRIARDGSELAVRPLAAEHVAALVASKRGAPPQQAELERLVAQTGGLPLFVLESLAASGTTTPALRESVTARVARLPDATRRALDACAVLGREVQAAPVAKMLGVLPARVIDDLAPAVRADIVSELAPGRFSFRHALVRDALYDALAATERVRLHALAADALGGASPDDALVRATHLVAACGAGDGDAIRDEVLDAAARVEAAGAYDRALALLESLLPAVGGDAHRLEMLLRAASLAERAGSYAALDRHASAAVELAKTRGDASALARAALLLGAELRPGKVSAPLVAALEAAERVVTEPMLLCRVRARLAAARQPDADPTGPITLARRAIADARALGDVRTLRDVLHVATSALIDFAPPGEVRALHEELYALALETGDTPTALRALQRQILCELELGLPDALGARVDQMLELATSLGHPRFRWRALLVASMRAAAYGRAAESAGYVREVKLLASAAEDVALPFVLGVHEVQHTFQFGTVDEVRRLGEVVEQVSIGIPGSDVIPRVYEACAFARLGMPNAKAAILALPIGAPALLHDAGLMHSFGEAVALADVRELVPVARERLARVGHVEITGGHVALSYDGPRDRVLAMLDARLGRAAEAAERLGDLRTRAEQRGFLPWVAHLAWNRAWALELAGDAQAARAQRDEALQLARAHGPAWIAEAGAVPPSAHAPSRPSLSLAKEGDAWRVHFAGRSLVARDGKGVQLLARLVARPDEDVHVVALVSGETDGGDAGTQLDGKAVAAYRDRLRTLRAELDDADAANDLGRTAKLRHEREMLEAEISRAVGLGGRMRRAGSATERARVNVQRRLKDAVSQLGALDPALGAYLEKALRTGTFCCFRP